MLIEISHKWYGIGLQLKVKPSALRRIRSQYSDPVECLREMLSDWLIGINPYPTWEALAQALESRSVKEGRLAKKVRETFLVSVTTTHPAPAPPTAHPYPIPQMGSSREYTYQVVADTVYRPPIQTRSGYNPAYLRLTQPTQRNHPYDIAYLPMAPTTMVSDEGTTNTVRTTEALLSKSHHA